MTLLDIARSSHFALGVAALLSYWVAALSRKGSRPHRYGGRVFVLVMLGLLLPAIPLSLRVVGHSPPFGAFLFYLLLITVTVLWQGWFAIRYKRDFAAYAGPGLRRLAWINIVAGAAVLVLGAVVSQPIFLGFSLIGLLGGRAMLRLIGSGPAHPRWWMEEHLGAMLGAGVATHIAFLSIGLPRLWPALSGDTLRNAAWFAPLLVALLARWWLGRKYLPVRPYTSPSSSQPSPLPR